MLLVVWVKDSVMVYTVLSRITGVSIGRVIFQNFSHSLAPSTLADSYSCGGIACTPDMNSRICTLQFHSTSTITLKKVLTASMTPDPR